MITRKKSILLIFCIFCFIEVHGNTYDDFEKSPVNERNVLNLRIFSEIYNSIRYFYPSKAAQVIDWDKFAIYGVRQVENCKNRQELLQKLQQIMLPICSELIMDTNEICLESYYPLNAVKREQWIHYGSGHPTTGFGSIYMLLYTISPPYKSKIVSIKSNTDIYWYKENIQNQFFFSFPNAAKKSKVTKEFKKLKSDVDTISLDQLNIEKKEAFINANKRSHRLATIIITWGNFRHFYPYQYLVSIDWDEVFTTSVSEAVIADDYIKFGFVLKKMLAPLQDGHIGVALSSQKGIYQRLNSGLSLPLDIRVINDSVVVKNMPSYLDNQIQKGSLIDSVNGIAISQLIKEKKQYISASEQRKNYILRFELLKTFYQEDSIFKLSLTSPKGEKYNQQIIATINDYRFTDSTSFKAEVAPNIYLLKLSSYEASIKKLHSALKELANKNDLKGIIIDIRNCRFMDDKFLGYFIDSTVFSTELKTPIFTKPKQVETPYHIDRFKIKPKGKKITSPIIFLTDASVMSYDESVMGIVDNYKIGTIVGEPTAGANGDVTYLFIPIHLLWYTGMRVDKHDGTPLFGKGITPTYCISPTIQNIIMGYDVQLDKAIMLLNQ